MIQKAPYGSPCNGCGECCRHTLCPLSEALQHPVKLLPCPFLMDTGEKADCGLIVAPGLFMRGDNLNTTALGRAAAVLVGAGIGCDCRLEGEPMPEGWIKHRDRAVKKLMPRVPAARRLWGV